MLKSMGQRDIQWLEDKELGSLASVFFSLKTLSNHMTNIKNF